MSWIKRWAIYTIISVTAGVVLGYILLLIWSVFRTFALNYGDSGPSWVNSVNNLMLYSGILIGIIGGQYFFLKKNQ